MPLVPPPDRVPADLPSTGVVRQGSWLSATCGLFDPRWRRDAAPLLDHFGAVIDHVEAYSKGGEHGEANFVTACCKCNVRKNSRQAVDYAQEKPGKPVKGKYGEPVYWDGLSSLFLVLADETMTLTASEKAWKQALEAHHAQGRPAR